MNSLTYPVTLSLSKGDRGEDPQPGRSPAGRYERGQAELAYLLILTFVAVPLYVVVQMLLRILLRYYETISFFLALPFP